jgi:hypothetical protein
MLPSGRYLLGELIKLQLDGFEFVGDRVEFTPEVANFVQRVRAVVCHVPVIAENGYRIDNGATRHWRSNAGNETSPRQRAGKRSYRRSAAQVQSRLDAWHLMRLRYDPKRSPPILADRAHRPDG